MQYKAPLMYDDKDINAQNEESDVEIDMVKITYRFLGSAMLIMHK